MASIPLDQSQITYLKQLAAEIAAQVQQFIARHSTVSVERALLRLYGVDGVDTSGMPLPNRLVEVVRQQQGLQDGVSRPFAAALLHSEQDVQTTAELLVNEKLPAPDPEQIPAEQLQEKLAELAAIAVAHLDRTRERKRAKQQDHPLPRQPWRYLIVATGNIYEDRLQAGAAVRAGADIIAVIRSTAQSLLDYVPYGATTEGFGGTYATQENFRIMRAALDEEMAEAGRYLQLVNYASGLCMPEIAACAALEDLDMLLNDSMYGILFRDINMQRTFVDQHFSRLLCGRAKILINTGEDNYLTTADAIDKAHTVTASQLINEALGRQALLSDALLGLGHAFEVDPQLENAFLFELAHAQLARQLFPNAPLKYMPPTRFKSTDIFASHCMDSLFNLASVVTGQGIHLAGILTEAIHTPLMQDRYQSLQNINYVFNVARNLGDEIEFKPDGFIARRAQLLLQEVEAFLEKVAAVGLMCAIEAGLFADIRRDLDGGKGLDGVFVKSEQYSNPVQERLEQEGMIDD